VKGSKWVGAGGVVSDVRYTEVKEFINGYIVVRGRRRMRLLKWPRGVRSFLHRVDSGGSARCGGGK